MFLALTRLLELDVEDEDHFIAFVDYYLDNKWISRAHLSPACKPGSGLHLKEGNGKLTAVEFCTKHGYWLSEAEL